MTEVIVDMTDGPDEDLIAEQNMLLPSCNIKEGETVPEDPQERMLRGRHSLKEEAECLPIVVWNPTLDGVGVWVKVREKDGTWTTHSKESVEPKTTKVFGGCHKKSGDSFKFYAQEASSGMSFWNGCPDIDKACWNTINIEVSFWYEFAVIRL